MKCPKCDGKMAYVKESAGWFCIYCKIFRPRRLNGKDFE